MTTQNAAEFELQCLLDDSPLPGAFVRVDALMKRKNDFGFTFGPSDDAGCISFSMTRMRELSDRAINSFIMDYVAFPNEWSGRLRVKVMTLDDISDTLIGISTWGPHLHIDGLEGLLTAGKDVIAAHAGAKAEVRVGKAPENVVVDAQSSLL